MQEDDVGGALEIVEGTSVDDAAGDDAAGDDAAGNDAAGDDKVGAWYVVFERVAAAIEMDVAWNAIVNMCFILTQKEDEYNADAMHNGCSNLMFSSRLVGTLWETCCIRRIKVLGSDRNDAFFYSYQSQSR